MQKVDSDRMQTLRLSHSKPFIKLIIGSAPQASVYFPELEDEHVVFERGSDNKYVAINKAQDPFVSLNRLPFGKRKVYAGDCLEIQDLVFKIFIEEEIQEEQAKVSEKTNTIKKEIEGPKEEIQVREIEDDLEQLLKQAEALQDPIIDSDPVYRIQEEEEEEKQDGQDRPSAGRIGRIKDTG